MNQTIQPFLARDRFAEHVGLELIEVGTGTAKVRMPVRPEHLNGVGVVHGGAIFALADFAFAAASNSHGTIALGINVSITYMKATRGGVLTATAKELSRNPKLGTYQVDITDDAGERVAVFQGLVYRKKDPLPAD